MSYTFHPASVARAVGSRDPEVARLLAEWQDIADGDPRDVDVTAALAKLVNLRTERYDLDCWDQRRRRVCVDVTMWEAAGVCFVRAQGCRDGRSYGAPTAVHEYVSPDDRAVWCARYLAAKRRRMRGW